MQKAGRGYGPSHKKPAEGVRLPPAENRHGGAAHGAGNLRRHGAEIHLHGPRPLERLGYITREAGLNRSIRVEGETPAAQVPILGKVTAGMPILAVEDIEGYIPFPQKAGKELFALHVSGLSMRDAGILDGDYVVAEQAATADDGDIVVAMIDEEATVKRLYREKAGVRLQPCGITKNKKRLCPRAWPLFFWGERKLSFF